VNSICQHSREGPPIEKSAEDPWVHSRTWNPGINVFTQVRRSNLFIQNISKSQDNDDQQVQGEASIPVNVVEPEKV